MQLFCILIEIRLQAQALFCGKFNLKRHVKLDAGFAHTLGKQASAMPNTDMILGFYKILFNVLNQLCA